MTTTLFDSKARKVIVDRCHSGGLFGAHQERVLFMCVLQAFSVTRLAKRLFGHVFGVFSVSGVVNRSVPINIAYSSVTRYLL